MLVMVIHWYFHNVRFPAGLTSDAQKAELFNY